MRGTPFTPEQRAKIDAVVAEVVALNQHPLDEHEIGDWINTLDDIIGEARDAIDDDPECERPEAVREPLLILAAVAIAAAASMGGP